MELEGLQDIWGSKSKKKIMKERIEFISKFNPLFHYLLQYLLTPTSTVHMFYHNLLENNLCLYLQLFFTFVSRLNRHSGRSRTE